MIDFSITHPSEQTSLFCLLLFVMVVVLFKPRMQFDDEDNIISQRWFLLLCGLIFFAVTDWIPGDWFHYQDFMYSSSVTHLERFYVLLKELVGHNYLLFRITVWGLASILFVSILNVLELDKRIGLWVLVTMYALLYSYARASLGMAVFFLGYSLLITVFESPNRFVRIVLGIALMVLSTLFHSSMIVLVLLSTVTFIPIKKKSLVFCFVLTGLIVFIGSKYLNQLISSDLITDDVLADKLSEVESGWSATRNINGRINDFLKFASIYFPVTIISFVVIRNREDVPFEILQLYKFILFIVAFALSMHIIFSNDVFYYRTLYMTIMPIAIVLTYLYYEGYLGNRGFYITVCSGLLFNGLVLTLHSL